MGIDGCAEEVEDRDQDTGLWGESCIVIDLLSLRWCRVERVCDYV